MVLGKDNAAPYKRMAEALDINDQVKFVGPVTDIERYYGAADIFVLPTLYDPFSNACLEAFGSGLPVITTAQNGFSELIEDGVNGFVIKDARSTMILTDRIETLLNIPGAGKNALKKAGSFTIEKNISQTLDLCGSLAASGKVIPFKSSQGRL
jgi:UDP-glucose:(heptosyl)LPS alpha-1,3-glucosyltransferase